MSNVGFGISLHFIPSRYIPMTPIMCKEKEIAWRLGLGWKLIMWCCMCQMSFFGPVCILFPVCSLHFIPTTLVTTLGTLHCFTGKWTLSSPPPPHPQVNIDFKPLRLAPICQHWFWREGGSRKINNAISLEKLVPVGTISLGVPRSSVQGCSLHFVPSLQSAFYTDRVQNHSFGFSILLSYYFRFSVDQEKFLCKKKASKNRTNTMSSAYLSRHVCAYQTRSPVRPFSAAVATYPPSKYCKTENGFC